MAHFNQILRKKRLQMIDDQWTKEAKAADKNAAEEN
jgi:hypothetical protein